MPGVWDTAEMLIAIAGDADAAATAARAMAEDCLRRRRRREGEYWLDVVLAVFWVANPQPLIAPRVPPEYGAAMPRRRPHGATVHRLSFAERLPRQRTRMLHIERKLRAILERERGADPAKPGKPEHES